MPMHSLLIIPDEVVISKIYLIRDQKVLLAADLADLYKVETKRLNEQVRRNPDRFPEDFMFQLTREEAENLKSHFATSSWGGRRTLPYAFTEHGVLMLSSVLSSERAVQVNIRIMRIYTRIREMLLTHKDILNKVELLEKSTAKQSADISLIFDYLKQLVTQKYKPVKHIGYKDFETGS